MARTLCRERFRVWIDNIRVRVLWLMDGDRLRAWFLRVRIRRRQLRIVVSHFESWLSNHRPAALNNAKNHSHNGQH